MTFMYLRDPAVVPGGGEGGLDVVFVAEGDLWGTSVGASPDAPPTAVRRLTDAPGVCMNPLVRPDGAHVVFSCTANGTTELRCVSIKGGACYRLTHLGRNARPVAWLPIVSQKSICGWMLIFSISNHTEIDGPTLHAVELDHDSCQPVPGKLRPVELNLGPASHLFVTPCPYEASLGDTSRDSMHFNIVIARHIDDAANGNWKGYAGGRSGELFLAEGSISRAALAENMTTMQWREWLGNLRYSKVALDPPCPISSPCVIGASGLTSVLFVSPGASRASWDAPCSRGQVRLLKLHGTPDDRAGTHEVVELASLDSKGDAAFWPRCLHASGMKESQRWRFVFTAGGELHHGMFSAGDVSCSQANSVHCANVDWVEWRRALSRHGPNIAAASDHLVDMSLDARGMSVVATFDDGSAYALGPFEGPAVSLAASSGDEEAPPSALCAAGVLAHLYDGDRVVLCTDATGEYDLEVHYLSLPLSSQEWDEEPDDSSDDDENSDDDGGGGGKKRKGGKDGKSHEKARAKPPTRHPNDILAQRRRRLHISPTMLGRPMYLACSPQAPLVAVANHRGELLLVDVDAPEVSKVSTHPQQCRCRVADVCRASPRDGIFDLVWSPCGTYLAYAKVIAYGSEVSAIFILDVRSGVCTRVTNPVLGDRSPSFDPGGKWLYFLGARDFRPMPNLLAGAEPSYAYGRMERPYVIPLSGSLNPLFPPLRPVHDDGDDDDDEEDDFETDSEDDDSDDDDDDDDDGEDFDPPDPITVNLDGICDRAMALPVTCGRYGRLVALENDKCMYTVHAMHDSSSAVGTDGGVLEADEDDGDAALGALLKYDMYRRKVTVLFGSGVSDVSLSMDGLTMLVWRSGDADEDSASSPTGHDVAGGGACLHKTSWYSGEEGWSLLVLPAGKKDSETPDDDEDGDPDPSFPGRESGLIDLDGRIALDLEPVPHFRRALRDAWRRVRDDGAWHSWLGDGDALSRSMASLQVSSSSTDKSRTYPPWWDDVYTRYQALSVQCATDGDVNDVILEMLAEAGASHVTLTDEQGSDASDFRSSWSRRAFDQAAAPDLGVDMIWDAEHSGYRVISVARGDSWSLAGGGCLAHGTEVMVNSSGSDDPVMRSTKKLVALHSKGKDSARGSGGGVRVGDVLLAVNGMRLTARRSPEMVLMGWTDGASAGTSAGSAEILLEVLRSHSLPQLQAAREASKAAATSHASSQETTGSSSNSAKKKAKKAAAERKKQAAALARLSDPSEHSVFLRTPMPRASAVANARWRDVIDRRANLVASRTNGVVLYVPLHEDMEGGGFAELTRALHRPTVDGQGRVFDATFARALLVDVRGNVGGHVSASVLSALRAWRKPWGIEGVEATAVSTLPNRSCLAAAAAGLAGGGGGDKAPPTDLPSGVDAPSPDEGVIVLLMDANTGSDAEVLCASARRCGAANAVIGETPSYGGVLGYDAEPEVGVGLSLMVASVGCRLIGKDVENRGVQPDVLLSPSDPGMYFQDDVVGDPVLIQAVDVTSKLLSAQTSIMSDAQLQAVTAICGDRLVPVGGQCSREREMKEEDSKWDFTVWRRLHEEQEM